MTDEGGHELKSYSQMHTYFHVEISISDPFEHFCVVEHRVKNSQNIWFLTVKGGLKLKFYLQIHAKSHNKISVSDSFEHFYIQKLII